MRILRPGFRQAVMTAVLGGALMLGGCLSGDGDPGAPSPSAEIASITRVPDAATLEARLKEGIRARTFSGAGGIVQDDADQPTGGAENTGAMGDTAARFSGTNLQEAGVDESDRMKSDGRHLYVLTQPEPHCCIGIGGVEPAVSSEEADASAVRQLRILALETDPPRVSETARLALGEDVGADGLYLYSGRGGSDADRLLVVGDRRTHAVDWYAPWTWRDGRIDLTEVDIAAVSAPAVLTRLHIDGHLVSTRRIGDMLYVVSRYSPRIAGYEMSAPSPEVEHANEQALAAATLGDLLPDWSLDGVPQGDLFAPEACYLLPVSDEDVSADLVTVSAFDLRDLSAPPRSSCLLGPSEVVYASTGALYVATTRYHYTAPSDGDSGGAVMLAYPMQMSTDVHKFALTADGPVLRGSASVPGHLGWHPGRKSFRMGEHQGVLGIVTSHGSWEGEEIRLTMLGEQGGGLVELAHLPSEARPARIGKPGERLYAVRFLGERAFAVTFRTVDPLYVFDLSDPADPFIAGELEMPGYSDYLHPVSATRLLGIGKDAVPAGEEGDGRGAWFQGVKLGLFDITNPQAPVEIDSVVLGRRGTEAGPLHDHHAMAWLEADPVNGLPARLALPVDLHDTPGPFSSPGNPAGWYGRTHSALYMFDIDSLAMSGAIEARGAVIADAGAGSDARWGHAGSDRAVIVGDDVHYLHGDEVWSARWGEAGSLGAAQ